MFDHSLLVAGRVGGGRGGGVRDKERKALKCTTLDVRDEFGEGALGG